jgi:hypothetical protein
VNAAATNTDQLAQNAVAWHALVTRAQIVRTPRT